MKCKIQNLFSDERVNSNLEKYDRLLPKIFVTLAFICSMRHFLHTVAHQASPTVKLGNVFLGNCSDMSYDLSGVYGLSVPGPCILIWTVTPDLQSIPFQFSCQFNCSYSLLAAILCS